MGKKKDNKREIEVEREREREREREILRKIKAGNVQSSICGVKIQYKTAT